MLRANKIITVALTSLCALFLSCCECGAAFDCVTYEVDGEAISVGVEYNNAYGDREGPSSVALPWSLTFTPEYRGDEYYGGIGKGEPYTAYLSATINSINGAITVRIYVGDDLVQEKSTDSAQTPVTVFYSVR